ncbi:MAG: efflux RND transporter periplasmic adaptor subunit [Gemmatimonadales bacterium]|jgi:RND family efflux transporter MFP subunit
MHLLRHRVTQLRITDIALAVTLCATTINLIGCGKGAADPKAPNAAGGAGGAKGAKTRSVAVAPSDIATVRVGSLSDGIAITGLLRPLESIDVHARIEGDLTGVYVREGQHVARGELLAQFESVAQQSGAASARAGQAAAKADLSQAEWNLKQSGDLFHAGAISEADYRASQQSADAARARLAAANAAVETASITARDTRVVAPMGGVIDKRLVDPGEHLSVGAPMFTLVNSQTLELAASVPERRAAAIKVGQRVAFSAQGLAFTGKVARVSPTIDPNTRAISVYVDVDNSSGTLKGNSLATGSVIASTVTGVLLVPTTALHQTADSGKTYVYRVNTGRIEQVYITLGVVNDQAGFAQVLSGLTTGDKVMVGNLGTLSPGTEIQIIGGDRARGKQ